MNIVTELEKALHDTSMVLADPNDTPKDNDDAPTGTLVKRAVICSSLAASYQFTRDEKNAFDFIHTGNTQILLSQMLGGRMSDLENKIGAFGNGSPGQRSVHEMFLSALTEIIKITRKNTGENADGSMVKNFFGMQRSNIVSYLPESLHIGDFMHNSSIDDRVNKMHGPFSDFFHWVEDILA